MDLGIASPELVCGAHESHSWVHQLGDIAEKGAQIKDLSERLAAHEKTKTKPWRKSYEVLRLKKRLADERKLKKIATHKVDDLLSSVPFIFLSPR
nr:hypothetical protein HmN_000872000 [Hymenolepis microstoma]